MRLESRRFPRCQSSIGRTYRVPNVKARCSLNANLAVYPTAFQHSYSEVLNQSAGSKPDFNCIRRSLAKGIHMCHCYATQANAPKSGMNSLTLKSQLEFAKARNYASLIAHSTAFQQLSKRGRRLFPTVAATCRTNPKVEIVSRPRVFIDVHRSQPFGTTPQRRATKTMSSTLVDRPRPIVLLPPHRRRQAMPAPSQPEIINVDDFTFDIDSDDDDIQIVPGPSRPNTNPPAQRRPSMGSLLNDPRRGVRLA